MKKLTHPEVKRWDLPMVMKSQPILNRMRWRALRVTVRMAARLASWTPMKPGSPREIRTKALVKGQVLRVRLTVSLDQE
jgi:hypothetical protein